VKIVIIGEAVHQTRDASMTSKLFALAVLIAAGSLAGAQEKARDEKVEMTRDEKAVLDATNKERAKEKLPPLNPNPILFRVARAHSSNMAKQNKMEHELDGKKPNDRTKEAGYKSGWIGENIAAGYEFPPLEVIKTWMASKGHRENILNPTYTEIGIGIARTPRGELYYTQVFGRPPRN
jgi:uncharacterized protein YkwD